MSEKGIHFFFNKNSKGAFQKHNTFHTENIFSILILVHIFLINLIDNFTKLEKNIQYLWNIFTDLK